MDRIEKIIFPHQFVLGLSPSKASLAVVSASTSGSPGELNSYVLKECGYSLDEFPRAYLQRKPYHLLQNKMHVPIMFVITVGQGKPEKALEKNLRNALIEYSEQINSATIWLPLMGTGAGGLTLIESYSITARVINSLQSTIKSNTSFLICLPDNSDGKKLFDILKNENSISSEGKNNLIDSNIEVAFKRFEGRYFLAGSLWEKEDQAKRFFEHNIWENGHEEKFVEIVNSVQIGDIVFLKSAYYANGISYLRIKGVGQVTSNPLTGTELDVDWKIKDIEVNIEGLGKYRSTFARVMPNDIETILIAIDKTIIYNAGFFNPTIKSVAINIPYQNRSTIVDLIADAGSGEDFLDIKKDISAFSKIMSAKSFKPPLAIALFGKWGAGKSFFMDKLKEQIQILTYSDAKSPYCKGIAQIHFNAWSYLDANLWASMVTKIFEGLNEYITKDSKAKQFKKEIEKELSQQLTVTKEEINILEKQKDAIEKQISALNVEKKAINARLVGEIKAIENSTLKDIIKNVDEQFNVKTKITEALQNNPTYEITEDQLKQIVPEKYWEDPRAAYDQIKSKYTFIKEFFRRDKIGMNLFWLCLIIVIILIVPTLLNIFTSSLKNINFLIPQIGLSMLITIGALWKRAETVYSRLQPLISSFWNIKENYKKQLNDALFQYEQKEKALKLRIEQNKNEIDTINQQVQQAIVTKTNLEFKINNALATEALYSFIEKRSNSEDYNKYLGIVSIIRKDFEILSSLFLEHNNENKEAEEFRKKFDTPLERIILYVDDLDRCSEERVVEVLEAVNLLMAFPLFIVVVGVDPRWVKNALIKKYHLQFTGHINGHNVSKELDVIEAANYLEKIFQVPFHLKEASDTSVKNMLKTLSEPRKDIQNPDYSDILEPIPSTTSNENRSEKIVLAEDTKSQTVINKQIADSKSHETEYLVLSEKEVKLMQDLSEVIGNNPRAIKRFVNVYQIVRAHEDLIFDGNNEEKEFLVLMFLLALPIGPFKKLAKYFKEFASDSDHHLKPLSIFLNPTYKIDGLDKLKHELNVKMSDKKSFFLLQAENMATFNQHNKFIQRFTFEDCI